MVCSYSDARTLHFCNETWEEVSMETQAGSRPLWPWAGLAAWVIGIIGTWIVVFLLSDDELKSSGAEFLEALDSGSNEVLYRVSSGLVLFAAAALVVFAIGLRRSLETRAPESLAPSSCLW
jgi:hypothetical protein